MRWKLLTRCFSKACIKRACPWKRLNARSCFAVKQPALSGRRLSLQCYWGYIRSFALVTGLLHFLQDAVEVVGLRRLHRRKLLVRHEFLFPEQLTDGQDVPVVEIGERGGAK